MITIQAGIELKKEWPINCKILPSHHVTCSYSGFTEARALTDKCNRVGMAASQRLMRADRWCAGRKVAAVSLLWPAEINAVCTPPPFPTMISGSGGGRLAEQQSRAFHRCNYLLSKKKKVKYQILRYRREWASCDSRCYRYSMVFQPYTEYLLTAAPPLLLLWLFFNRNQNHLIQLDERCYKYKLKASALLHSTSWEKIGVETIFTNNYK